MKRWIAALLLAGAMLSACGTAPTNETQEKTETPKPSASVPAAVEEQGKPETSAQEAPKQETSVQEEATQKKTEQSAPPQGTDTTDNSLQQTIERLSLVGDTSVVAGVVYVNVTIPSEYHGFTSQEALDAETGELFTSAKLNEDGSVTYRMSAAQYDSMLLQMKKEIGEAIMQMVENTDFGVTAVVPSEDYTSYELTVSKNEIGINQATCMSACLLYGRLMNHFTGNRAPESTVRVYNAEGKLLEEYR